MKQFMKIKTEVKNKVKEYNEKILYLGLKFQMEHLHIQGEKEILKTIFLPIPKNIGDNNQIDWGDGRY